MTINEIIEKYYDYNFSEVNKGDGLLITGTLTPKSWWTYAVIDIGQQSSFLEPYNYIIHSIPILVELPIETITIELNLYTVNSLSIAFMQRNLKSRLIEEFYKKLKYIR